MISITSLRSKVFEKIVAGKLSHFLESNSLLPSSQFSYCTGLGTRAFASIGSPSTGCFGQGHGGKLNFSAAFDTVSHYGLLHKLRSIGIGGQLLSIVSAFLSDSMGSACIWMAMSGHQLMLFRECPRVSF